MSFLVGGLKFREQVSQISAFMCVMFGIMTMMFGLLPNCLYGMSFRASAKLYFALALLIILDSKLTIADLQQYCHSNERMSTQFGCHEFVASHRFPRFVQLGQQSQCSLCCLKGFSWYQCGKIHSPSHFDFPNVTDSFDCLRFVLGLSAQISCIHV